MRSFYLWDIYEEAQSWYNRSSGKGCNNGANLKTLPSWLELLKKENFKQKFTHTENGIFLRKQNDKDLNRIFPKVFDKLMERELCRDQHVFPYVLQKEKFPEEKFLIVDWF